MSKLTIRWPDGSTRDYPLGEATVTIGRARENDIFLADPWLSRHHAEVRSKADDYYLVDLASKNGTLLNGSRIQGEPRLAHDDVITLGEHSLVFSSEPKESDADALLLTGVRSLSARSVGEATSRRPESTADLMRQNRLLGILSQAASALLIHRPLAELFEMILDLLFGSIPAERGAILLLEGSNPHPVLKASRNRKGGPITSISRSITRRVIEERMSLLLPNILDDSSLRAQESIAAIGTRAALCAPLWLRSGGGDVEQVLGVVYLDILHEAGTFSEEDLELLTALANIAAARIENSRLIEERIEKKGLEEDLRMAAEVQSSLLPKAAPKVPGYQLVGSNRPCRAIGGDYYDFGQSRNGLNVALGDVSGKGASAALLMAVLRTAVRSHWEEDSLEDVVRRINRTVCQSVSEGKYITFFLARLDPPTGRLVYVNAGHNPPFLLRSNGEVEKLVQADLVLGMFETADYVQDAVQLDAGDTLVIFSDGVTETWSPESEEFGEVGLASVLSHARGLGADAMEARILEALDRHACGMKATDDRTLVVLKRSVDS